MVTQFYSSLHSEPADLNLTLNLRNHKGKCNITALVKGEEYFNGQCDDQQNRSRKHQ